MSSDTTKARRRGPGKPWPKGTSGNPAGRPRLGTALAEITREVADPHEMVSRAVSIMRGDDDTRALAALTWLRDSGYMRPPTQLEAHVTGSASSDSVDWSRVPLEDRQRLLANMRAIREATANTPADVETIRKDDAQLHDERNGVATGGIDGDS